MTPPATTAKAARVTRANPGNALVGHRVIVTVPGNFSREPVWPPLAALHLSLWLMVNRTLPHKRKLGGEGESEGGRKGEGGEGEGMRERTQALLLSVSNG